MRFSAKDELALGALVALGALLANVLPVSEVAAKSASTSSVANSTSSLRCNREGGVRTQQGVRQICMREGGLLKWTRVAKKPLRLPNSTSTSTITPQATPPLIITDVEKCKLKAPLSDFAHSLGFPRPNIRLNSTGRIRLAVIFTDFSDSPATRSLDSVFAMISPGAEEMYFAMSYGRLQMELVPVMRWLRLPRPSTDYRMKRGASFITHREYIVDALNAAGPYLDNSAFDGFVVLTNPYTPSFDYGPAFTPNSPFWAATAAGRNWMNGASSGTDLNVWGHTWLNHELGHAMGLPDLYSFSGLTHRWVGEWSLMGLNTARGREFLGWERWFLGWISDSQVVCEPEERAKVMLSPIAREGGQKILTLRIDSHRVLVVESRRKLGYDARIAKEGILAYVVDSDTPSGEGPVKVLPHDPNDFEKMAAPLSPGESLTFEGIRITYEQRLAIGDVISVNRP